jgi:fatty acid desaturase
VTRWAERAAALAVTTTAAAAILWLSLTIPWALAVLLISWSAFALGWFCAVSVVRGRPCRACQSWESYAAELETGLAKAEAANAELNTQVEVAFSAGMYHGQVFQADRGGNGL